MTQDTTQTNKAGEYNGVNYSRSKINNKRFDFIFNKEIEYLILNGGV